MTQLLFIETFVLGSSLIAAIYHFVLFIQQKDRFLLFYSLYLFTATAYLIFKLCSHNYDPFLPTNNTVHYAIEEVLQVTMYSSYATFAAVTLECTRKPLIIKWCWIGLLIFSGITIIIHISKAIIFGPGITTRTAYAISRLTTIGIAGFALFLAWRIRRTVFQKTIILGSYVYAFFAMLSVFSFVFGHRYVGFGGVEPYLIGSFIDIIIFSGALGYRFKKIADEKNQLLQFSLKTSEARTQIANTLNSNVGAALSSIHLYASVANKTVDSQPEKAKEYLQQINTGSLQLMNEVADLVWALHLNEANIGENLQTRIKVFGYEMFGLKDIACSYHFNTDTITSIQDIAMATAILTFIKAAALKIIAAPTISEVQIAIYKQAGQICVSVNDYKKTFI